jgi:4a-hydroxytetrahydrobiopterin dehydratase
MTRVGLQQGATRIMTDLADRACVPCKGGTPPLQGEELEALSRELGSNWRVIDAHHLEKFYPFENFVDALAFTNRIGELAETHNHHPDIELAWGKVKLTIFTHTIEGLSETDFVWAAKADQLLDPSS